MSSAGEEKKEEEKTSMEKWLGRRDCVIKERGKDRDGKGVKEGRNREPQEQVDREGGSKKKKEKGAR